jgi:hypothetical protein
MQKEREDMENRLKNVSAMERKETEMVRRMQETQKKFERVQIEVRNKGSQRGSVVRVKDD